MQVSGVRRSTKVFSGGVQRILWLHANATASQDMPSTRGCSLAHDVVDSRLKARGMHAETLHYSQHSKAILATDVWLPKHPESV